MMTKLSLKDLDLKDKKVLMRVDFNVPQDALGVITDDTRIRATLPSINYILDHGGKLILMSHLGKPKGNQDAKFSLAPVATRISELLKKPVHMCKDCIGGEVQAAVDSLKANEVILLENLRFHQAEENPEMDLSFAKTLSSYGDLFINDAFGTAHRSHSSTVEVAKYFPGKAAAGFLMEKEIQFLGNALLNPERPFYAIIGGAKISSKLGIIESLLNKADAIFVGGGMAYTFLKAQGFSIGNSICENDLIEKAKHILEISKSQKVDVILPVDHLITNDLKGSGTIKVILAKDGIPDGFYGVDIGPATIKLFSEKLKSASTVLWNGPLGIFENEKFSHGTCAIAEILSELKGTTIVGGGDSIAALQATGVSDKISHVSTGGGASLEYIEYGTLPGIEVLSDKIIKN